MCIQRDSRHADRQMEARKWARWGGARNDESLVTRRGFIWKLGQGGTDCSNDDDDKCRQGIAPNSIAWKHERGNGADTLVPKFYTCCSQFTVSCIGLLFCRYAQ